LGFSNVACGTHTEIAESHQPFVWTESKSFGRQYLVVRVNNVSLRWVQDK
jgi:hypothetical protein